MNMIDVAAGQNIVLSLRPSLLTNNKPKPADGITLVENLAAIHGVEVTLLREQEP